MNRYLRAFAVALAAATICVAGQAPAPKGPHTKGPGPALIKGVVRDQAKQPIAGVGISIEGVSGYAPVGARAVTDSNGAYSKVLQHIDGKYRVTPVNGGYQFTPGSAEVSGSGGTANFTGTRKK